MSANVHFCGASVSRIIMVVCKLDLTRRSPENQVESVMCGHHAVVPGTESWTSRESLCSWADRCKRRSVKLSCLVQTSPLTLSGRILYYKFRSCPSSGPAKDLFPTWTECMGICGSTISLAPTDKLLGTTRVHVRPDEDLAATYHSAPAELPQISYIDNPP